VRATLILPDGASTTSENPVRIGQMVCGTGSATATVSWSAVFTKSGTHTLRAQVSGYDTENVPQTVSNSKSIVVNPPPAGRVQGSVVDADTLLSIQSGTVSGSGPSPFTVSISGGAYSSPDLVAGSYTIQASAAGYQSQTKSVSIIAGQTVTLDFKLTKIITTTTTTVVTSTTATTAVTSTTTTQSPDQSQVIAIPIAMIVGVMILISALMLVHKGGKAGPGRVGSAQSRIMGLTLQGRDVFCSGCGRIVPRGASTCPRCGRRIRSR